MSRVEEGESVVTTRIIDKAFLSSTVVSSMHSIFAENNRDLVSKEESRLNQISLQNALQSLLALTSGIRVQYGKSLHVSMSDVLNDVASRKASSSIAVAVHPSCPWQYQIPDVRQKSMEILGGYITDVSTFLQKSEHPVILETPENTDAAFDEVQALRLSTAPSDDPNKDIGSLNPQEMATLCEKTPLSTESIVSVLGGFLGCCPNRFSVELFLALRHGIYVPDMGSKTEEVRHAMNTVLCFALKNLSPENIRMAILVGRSEEVEQQEDGKLILNDITRKMIDDTSSIYLFQNANETLVNTKE